LSAADKVVTTSSWPVGFLDPNLQSCEFSVFLIVSSSSKSEARENLTLMYSRPADPDGPANPMNKPAYLESIKLVIEQRHKCSARFLRTERVREEFEGKRILEGDVEVFGIESTLTNAKCCYGWSFGNPEEFITILELPPVDSAQVAVKVAIACRIKEAP
jgi:hypothetical protein